MVSNTNRLKMKLRDDKYYNTALNEEQDNSVVAKFAITAKGGKTC